jgi:hypothetical protein
MAANQRVDVRVGSFATGSNRRKSSQVRYAAEGRQVTALQRNDAMGHSPTSDRSLDHVIGAGREHGRHINAKRLCRL